MQEIGQVANSKHANPSKPETEYVRKGKAIYEPLNNFGKPRKGAEAERRSVFLQASRVLGKSGKYEPKAIEAFQHHYTQSQIPSVFQRFDQGRSDRIEVTGSELRNFLGDIDRTSTPGFPLDSLSPTNGPIIDKYADLILGVVNDRLNALYNSYDKVYNSTIEIEPYKLCEMNLVDAMRVFIKGEPHSISKIEEGRLRIIFSVGFIDNLIARILCSKMKKQEIANCDVIPSKPGMGLHDEGLKSISSYVRSMQEGSPTGDIFSLDVKAWDWSMTWADFLFDYRRRVSLVLGSRSSSWFKVLFVHMYCMARKVLIFSDGTMVQQLVPGVMPSGWYLTSDTNSGINVGIAFSKFFKENPEVDVQNVPFDSYKPAANGDDIIVSGFGAEEWREHYHSFGKIMSLCEKITWQSFEFCSTQFMDNGLGYPVRVAKTMYNMLDNKPNNVQQLSELLMAFRFNLRHHVEKDHFEEIIKATGFLDMLEL